MSGIDKKGTEGRSLEDINHVWSGDDEEDSNIPMKEAEPIQRESHYKKAKEGYVSNKSKDQYNTTSMKDKRRDKARDDNTYKRNDNDHYGDQSYSKYERGGNNEPGGTYKFEGGSHQYGRKQNSRFYDIQNKDWNKNDKKVLDDSAYVEHRPVYSNSQHSGKHHRNKDTYREIDHNKQSKDHSQKDSNYSNKMNSKDSKDHSYVNPSKKTGASQYNSQTHYDNDRHSKGYSEHTDNYKKHSQYDGDINQYGSAYDSRVYNSTHHASNKYSVYDDKDNKYNDTYNSKYNDSSYNTTHNDNRYNDGTYNRVDKYSNKNYKSGGYKDEHRRQNIHHNEGYKHDHIDNHGYNNTENRSNVKVINEHPDKQGQISKDTGLKKSININKNSDPFNYEQSGIPMNSSGLNNKPMNSQKLSTNNISGNTFQQTIVINPTNTDSIKPSQQASESVPIQNMGAVPTYNHSIGSSTPQSAMQFVAPNNPLNILSMNSHPSSHIPISTPHMMNYNSPQILNTSPFAGPNPMMNHGLMMNVLPQQYPYSMNQLPMTTGYNVGNFSGYHPAIMSPMGTGYGWNPMNQFSMNPAQQLNQTDLYDEGEEEYEEDADGEEYPSSTMIQMFEMMKTLLPNLSQNQEQTPLIQEEQVMQEFEDNERLNMQFDEGSAHCVCCRGFTFNCHSQICRNLGQCHCVMRRENEITGGPSSKQNTSISFRYQ